VRVRNFFSDPGPFWPDGPVGGTLPPSLSVRADHRTLPRTRNDFLGVLFFWGQGAGKLSCLPWRAWKGLFFATFPLSLAVIPRKKKHQKTPNHSSVKGGPLFPKKSLPGDPVNVFLIFYWSSLGFSLTSGRSLRRLVALTEDPQLEQPFAQSFIFSWHLCLPGVFSRGFFILRNRRNSVAHRKIFS